jgi:allantoin racemase
MVGCFLDPGIEEARAIVNIPVIGLGESAMHFACLFGHRFAIVTANDPKLVSEMEIELRLYGLEAQTVLNPVRRISLSEAEVLKSLMEDPKIVASDVLERAKKCVEDGAEVVVVGCNLLGPLCALSDLAEVEEVHAPILDCTSVAIKMAETIVDFKNRLGVPPISRAGIYRLPREKDIKRVRNIFGLKVD